MARPRARAGDSRSRLRRRRRRAGSPSPGATGSGNATDGRAGARPSPLSGRRPGASPPYFRAVTALGRNAVPVAGRRPLYGILSHLLPLALARLLLAGALSHWPASAGAAPMDRAIAPPAPPTGASGPTPCGSFWQPIGGPDGRRGLPCWRPLAPNRNLLRLWLGRPQRGSLRTRTSRACRMWQSTPAMSLPPSLLPFITIYSIYSIAHRADGPGAN